MAEMLLRIRQQVEPFEFLKATIMLYVDRAGKFYGGMHVRGGLNINI